MAKLNGDGLGYSYHLPSGGWSLRLRNILSQFCELFSEFDKYIAPAYHHDRCERSVQMRLYTMHKREFVMTFIAFFTSLGLAIFIGVAGPPITSTAELDGKLLLPKNNQSNLSQALIASGPFTMRTPSLTTYSQQLWLIVKLTTGNKDDEIYDKSFQVSITIEGLTEEHKPISVVDTKHSRNRTRHLRCENQNCDEFIVLHLGYLDYTHYILTVRFHGLEAFHKRYNINQVTFYFKTYNPGFTKIEIWFRFVFLLTTFLISCWFANSLKKYAMHDWSIEQKWMSFLLPCLIGYNNPVFPMMFLVHSWIPGLIDAFAQATFLCALLLFWLCIYHGLRQNERKFLTFYVPKLFLVAMLWFPAIILSTWEKVNELEDPTYNHEVDTSNYYVVQSFFYIFSVVYIIYLGLLILRAYTELRSMPFFDLRLKYLTLLMVIVLSISCVITFLRFGVGFLEDNFVARLSTHYTSSAQFMAFYGLLNFYLYTMAYVYSPGNSSAHEFAITKDNPAFSMINDSDEDVIYGSDEESRRPLNRSRNDDDSD
ncbi:transmembrane protein 181 [Coccinella septempunctata]|uniref:transmembrane protein 181 n=1 Tax=Coccinella septempunctata TaxID=41139 RepID=UPI001D094AF4|nr:transmembrane protein 181 [Coccinella septempunctata]